MGDFCVLKKWLLNLQVILSERKLLEFKKQNTVTKPWFYLKFLNSVYKSYFIYKPNMKQSLIISWINVFFHINMELNSFEHFIFFPLSILNCIYMSIKFNFLS